MNLKNYFILPGLYSLQKINIGIKLLQNNFPFYFYQNTYIYYVYGSFPNSIWNGDNLIYSKYQPLNNEIINIMQNYVNNNLILIQNFNNSEINKNDCENTYCNLLTDWSLSVSIGNQFSVNSKKLSEYLIQKHPNISKIYIGPNNSIPLNNNEQFEYFLNPIHNTNIEELKKLKNKNKVIITLNPICPLCNNKNECGLRENLAQLNYDPQSSKNNICSFLKFKQYQLSKNKKIEPNQIIKLYNEIGFNHFFIEEYPSIDENIEEYLFFLIKPEYYQSAKDLLNEFIKEVKNNDRI